MRLCTYVTINCNLNVVDCPPRYKMASKNPATVCIKDFCPMPLDIQLDECIKSCTEIRQCHVFKHVNVGKTRQCFHYGYDEEEGRISDDPCENKLGNTCCEKSK